MTTSLLGMVVSTDSEAAGAWPNGTRVCKLGSDPGDTHKDGAPATVVGSVGPDEDGTFGYFVRWDDLPDLHVFCTGTRLALRRPQA